MLSKSLAALTALSATASAQVDYAKLDYHGHYFRQEWINQPLNVQRLDPILNPGQLSPHVHSFIGAPVISANTSFADTQKASCSQVYVKPDKSVYWMPSLYFQSPKNQSFIRVPEHHRVLYYFNRASDPKTNQQNFDLIEEFPPNFRMIAGDSMLRSPATTKQMQGAVEWFCHGPDVKSSGFPAGFTSCANGLAGSIHFPYCWNGQDFNVSAPQAHMSYPVGDYSDSGACPSTHPHVLPHIFIEFWFDVSSFNGQYGAGDNPWVLSNGDPTGYSFHADFLNGWTPGVLGKAMKTCNIGESGEPLSNCFEVNTDAERNACSQPAVVDEKVDGWLPALPGCNPIQKGPEKATAVANCNVNPTINGKAIPTAASSAVASGATAAYGSKSSGVALPVASLNAGASNGASSAGGNAGKAVYSGAQAAAAPVASAISGTVGGMTGGSNGATYAGSNGGSTGGLTSGSVGGSAPKPASPAIPSIAAPVASAVSGGSAAKPAFSPAMPSAAPSYPSAIVPSGNKAVPGSSSSKSTGSNDDSQDSHGSMPSASSLKLPASWTSAGCYSDAVNPRSLSGETFAWFGEKMTATGCANHCATKGFSISGVEFGQQCFCSNSLDQSNRVDDAQCGMPCVGAAGQTCGGDGMLSVYTKGGKDPLSAAFAAVPAVMSPVASYAGSKSSAVPVAPVASSPVANNASPKSSAAPAVPVASSPVADEESSAGYASHVEPATTPAPSLVASAPVVESPAASAAATPVAEPESVSEPASSTTSHEDTSYAEPAYARRHVGGGAIVRM
ncbi:uncharacterized protein IWZ02DRAFT_39953 [Phyllosticta citriasiana]|uniref:WSC domain-containing protein n=1 Tax=Phyllosticta citriasiana TaxID=595635 RepID=A0ABR1KBD1_9PEZI